jgi:hypothetical protein
MRRGPRPSLVQASIAFLTANACALSYSLGYFEAAWVWWLALFLVMEIGAAISREPGDTLSECVYLWFGIRPVQPSRVIRIPICGLFMAELGAHFVTGGALPWTGGPVVIATAIPVAAVIVHSLLERREGRAKWASSGRR